MVGLSPISPIHLFPPKFMFDVNLLFAGFCGKILFCCLPALTNIPLFLQTVAFSCIVPTQRRSQPLINCSVKTSAHASTSLLFIFTLVLLCCTLP